MIERSLNSKDLVKFLEKNRYRFPDNLNEIKNLENFSEKVIKKGVVYFYYLNKQPVGLISGYMNNTETFTSYVNLLVISESYSHRGIGNLLLQTFEKEAQKNGMLFNTLKVVKDNENAMKLYEKSGYKIVADDNDRYVLSKLL